jgi:uncharacterized protein (DUF1697 family)
VTRYFAFLRAINVGGRVVKMEELRAIFEACGLKGAETFIASGNVTFQAPSGKGLETKIEKQLKAALGYDVETFVRDSRQLLAVHLYQPFPKEAMEAAHSVSVGFTRGVLDPGCVQQFNSAADEFHVQGSEVYWRALKPQNETKVNPKKFERAIGGPVTFRNLNTIARLTAKYIR